MPFFSGRQVLVLLTDWHIHTSDFSDGEMTLSEIVEIAGKKKVQIGISDHWIHGMKTADELERYLDALDQYPNVYKGLEVSLNHPFEVPENLLNRLDYIIGSLHDVDVDGKRRGFGLDAYFRYLLGENPNYTGPDSCWDSSLLDEALDIFLRSLDNQPINILGHCTLLPPLFLKDPETIFSEEWEDKLVDGLSSHGVSLEISSAWHLPHTRLLRKAYAKGVTFAFGSDSHRLNMVGDLDFCVQAARTIGITDADMFRVKK